MPARNGDWKGERTFVVCPGVDSYPMRDGVDVMGLRSAMEALT